MTRTELYALVWSGPLYLLAPRLGRSGRGLASLCARYDIPVPSRGFWAKRAAGKAVSATKLPNPGRDPPVPELRAYDAFGHPRPVEDLVQELPEEWVIPGMLKRVFPDARAPMPPPVTPARKAAQDLRHKEYERALVMAAQYDKLTALTTLLDALEKAASALDVASRMGLLDWVQLVRQELRAADPVAQLLAEAVDIAAGKLKPPWR